MLPCRCIGCPIRQKLGGGARFAREAERELKWVVKTLSVFWPAALPYPVWPCDVITKQAKTNSPRCITRACSRSRRPGRPLTCRNTAP